MPTIPPLLGQSLVEKVAEMQRWEFDLARRVRYPYESVLQSWRDLIERTFLASFTFSMETSARRQIWNPAIKPTVQETLIDPLDEAMRATEDDLITALEGEEDDAYWLGALYGLWGLSLAGVAVDQYRLPPRQQVRDLVAANAIEGYPLSTRLRTWGTVYRGKLRHILTGSIVGGEDLPTTLERLRAVQHGLLGRVTVLVTNEAFRASIHGEETVYRAFDIGWLWVTKDDERVCPMCAPLHMTITTKVPVDDTHPDCRCSILPSPVEYNPTPSSFAAFAQRVSL